MLLQSGNSSSAGFVVTAFECICSLLCGKQFRKNKVREYADSDSDCDQYEQEDRGLVLRQVPEAVYFLLCVAS